MSYSYEVASSYERKEPQYTLDAASDPIVEKEIDGLKQKDLVCYRIVRLLPPLTCISAHENSHPVVQGRRTGIDLCALGFRNIHSSCGPRQVPHNQND